MATKRTAIVVGGSGSVGSALLPAQEGAWGHEPFAASFLNAIGQEGAWGSGQTWNRWRRRYSRLPTQGGNRYCAALGVGWLCCYALDPKGRVPLRPTTTLNPPASASA